MCSLAIKLMSLFFSTWWLEPELFILNILFHLFDETSFPVKYLCVILNFKSAVTTKDIECGRSRAFHWQIVKRLNLVTLNIEHVITSLFQIHNPFTNMPLKEPYTTAAKNLTLVIVLLIDVDLIWGSNSKRVVFILWRFYYRLYQSPTCMSACRLSEVCRAVAKSSKGNMKFPVLLRPVATAQLSVS